MNWNEKLRRQMTKAELEKLASEYDAWEDFPKGRCADCLVLIGKSDDYLCNECRAANDLADSL